MSDLNVPRSGATVVTRRRLLGGLGLALGATAVSGCNSSASGQRPSDTAYESSGAGYPVTVKHRFGSTTIDSSPKRIVALGQTDLDPVIALGFTPIAVGSFEEDWYSPKQPWNASGFSADGPQEINFIDIQPEQVAALKPDLITCVSGGLDASKAKTLSKFCPVIGPPVGYQDYAVPYGQQTELIGKALGREQQARKLVADVDAKFAAVREAHPQWQQLTAICAEVYGSDYDILGSSAPRTIFLTSLGFGLDPTLNALTGKDYSQALSAEKLDLIGDLDLVVWCTDAGQLEQMRSRRLIKRLPSTREGHSLWTTGDKSDRLLWAMDFSTVLSAPYAIEHGVSLIEAAVDGRDPAGQRG
ncbi:MAG TPA: ABC transporter substrate-binding protein [Microlunatus sp.]